jgi:hypothetical protein
MRRLLLIPVIFCSVLWLAGQQVIDRIVVVVNGRVITQHDWEVEEHFEALAEGHPAETIQHSPSSLERLVDRVLLLQQMEQLNFRPPSAESITQETDSIKKQLPPSQASTDDAWHHTLQTYGIPEDDFKQMVTDQANVLRFIDVRFRSNARIAQFEIDDYYSHNFVPEFQKASPGQTPPPLSQVQNKIQQILVEQRVTEGLNSFVQSLRAQAVIHRITPMTENK